MSKHSSESPAVQKDWFARFADDFHQTAKGPFSLFLVGTIGFWVALYQFSDSLTAILPRINWLQVTMGIGVPLSLYLLVFQLPAWMRRRQEQKLANWGLTLPSHDYFQLAPYTQEDAQRFPGRADQGHIQVLQWLKRPRDGIFYLTGRSGTGKSSLLSAFVLPKLSEQEPRMRTVMLRTAEDSTALLADKLREPDRIWKQPPQDLPADMASLLRRVSERLQDQGERLLIVLDQFEEFLILRSRGLAQPQPLEELLAAISRKPIDSIGVFIVLRSDYQAALFDLELPRLNAGDNWREIGPFREDAAREFLQGAGLNLSAELMETLVRRASDLDETPGFIRPIVLNMIGKALEARTAGDGPLQLERQEAERLLTNYVRTALRDPLVRGHAPAVLQGMLTEEGIKAPTTVGDLAAKTKLQPKVVSGCLARLALTFGFVRQLDPHDERPVDQHYWEIAHDFLARLLHLVLASWRPVWWSRLRPWLAPLLISLAIVAVPLVLAGVKQYRIWKLNRWADRHHLALQQVADGQYFATSNANLLPAEDPETSLLDAASRDRRLGLATDEGNQEESPAMRAIKQALEDDVDELLVGINLADNELSAVSPELGELGNLKMLNLAHNKLKTLPDALRQLRRLEELNIADNPNLGRVPTVVFELSKLASLDLARNDLEELPPEINKLAELRMLHLPRNLLRKLPAEIGDLKKLTQLHLSRNDYLSELPPQIGRLENLVELHVSNCQLTQLPAEIGTLSKLKTLHISDNRLTQVPSGVCRLAQLEQLDLRGNQITELPEQIMALKKLRRLDLTGNPIAELPPNIKEHFAKMRTTVHPFDQRPSTPGGGGGGGGGGHGGGSGRDGND